MRFESEAIHGKVLLALENKSSEVRDAFRCGGDLR
jgi:hypothetical protein